MPRWIQAIATMIGALALLTTGTVTAPGAAADPDTTVNYPARASADRYRGRAFESCSAPSLATMTAWKKSPYHAVGIYIGGIGLSCKQRNLTPSWVSKVSALGWKLIPTYLGLQPPCLIGDSPHEIDPARAVAQGADAATRAVAAAKALRIQPGSALYLDMEHYDPDDVPCGDAVLDYFSGYTRELHRRGFLSGLYANLSSAIWELAYDYDSTVRARPDALWVASWTGDARLAPMKLVPATSWSMHQRAKQYLGPRDETYGRVRINLDRDNWDAPVATVARPQRIRLTTKAHTAPSTSASSAVATVTKGTAVQVICQASGSQVGGTRVWDKLSTGRYVSNYDVDTPNRTGRTPTIPLCTYPYQVKPATGSAVRAGPGGATKKQSTLNGGALAWIICQKAVTPAGASAAPQIWDRLDSGGYVADTDVATSGKSGFTPPIPRC